MSLTKLAITLREEKIQDAKKSSFSVEYDQVWVVFDLEAPTAERRRNAQKAKNLKDAQGINFADSNPCFEYWLLLHYVSTTKAMTCCRNVVRELRKHCKSYQKNFSPEQDLVERFATAIKNAEAAAQQCISGDALPPTRVHQLVRLLYKESPQYSEPLI